MNRICVLSTNDNPDYWFYLPIVAWLWNKFGWKVAVFITQDVDVEKLTWYGSIDRVEVHRIPTIEGVRPGTHAQTVRHFAANVLPQDAYIMVQDIDLLPLKDFWHPDFRAKTIYGWELTGKSFIPVHYTGMLGKYWYEIMGCTGDLRADMEREFKANGRAYEKEWQGYWDTDWDILTQKFKAYGLEKFTFIERGLVQLAKDATPKGRIDRYDFEATMNQEEYLDAHMENHNPSAPEKVAFMKTILERCYGEVPSWFDDYCKQHHEKYGQGR